MARQRRLVPVREDIVEELVAIARRSGLTVAELVEAILSHAVKVLRGRDDVAGVLADSIVYADITRLGGVPVPVRGISAILRACSGGGGCGSFVSEVARLAHLVALSTKARGVSIIDGLPVVAKVFLAGAAVDLVDEGGGVYRLVVASSHPDEVVGLYEAVARSIVEGFGCSIVRVERSNGLLVLVFRVPG